MSSPSSKKAAVRYTEEEKKEIIDFVLAYNTANKRGGQTKAVQKYKVSAVTLNNWLKDAEASAKKSAATKKSRKSPVAAVESAAKVSPAAEATPADAVSVNSSEPVIAIETGKGRRYTSAEKNQILDFIEEYNRTHGRGGQSKAAAKFNVSVMTISGWRNSLAGSFRARKTPSAVSPAISSNLVAKVNQLIEIGQEIRNAETELAKLKVKFDSLSASIKASL